MRFKEQFKFPMRELIEGKRLTELAEEKGITVEGIRKKIPGSIPESLVNRIRAVVEREGFIFARRETPFGRFLFYLPFSIGLHRKVMYKNFVVRYRDDEAVSRIRKEVLSLKKRRVPFLLTEYLKGNRKVLYRIFALKVLRAEIVRFDGSFYVVSIKDTSRVNFTLTLPEGLAETLSPPYGREIKEVFFSTPKERRFNAYEKWREKKREKSSSGTKVVSVNLSAGEFELLEKESSRVGIKVPYLLKAVFLSERA